MHDYHAIKAVVERLTAELPSLGLEKIAEVRIRAGAAYSADALTQAWEMLTKQTPLEGSRLTVDLTAQEHTCSSCGKQWTPAGHGSGHLLECPACGALQAVEGGRAIEVLSVTGEPAGSE